MTNTVYLRIYFNGEEFKSKPTLPLESILTFCIYHKCAPDGVDLKFVYSPQTTEKSLFEVTIEGADLSLVDEVDIPWQVASCIYPVVIFEDTIITGLCAVARHICKFRAQPGDPKEHEEGLLGFRRSCLQAPNEVSIWTKFCEVDLIKTIKELVNNKGVVKVVPKHLARFEKHLTKPIRVHNVYKLARDLKKDILKTSATDNINKEKGENSLKTRLQQKPRKWKSNVKKELQVDCSTKIEDLDINHQFAEGPFMTLADLILLPSYHILIYLFGENLFQSLLPITFKWYKNLINMPELCSLVTLMNKIKVNQLLIEDITLPNVENVSLYKSDPKRHNPKKRLFTKEVDIEDALSSLLDGMELDVVPNELQFGINWNEIPDGANPKSGHLPDERMVRKSEQLENLVLTVKNVAKEGDLIVDFCSGSGHLGILIAHMLPKCTVILLENKEQSLTRARARVHEMGLTNVYFFQCNLDFFIGKFDVGVALHACGIASDLVLDKCLKVKGKFVLCPCCYGSLHVTDRLVYPRSSKFGSLTVDQYMCIGHAADQTHEEHPLTLRGARCMAAIDSDRARLAEEQGYKVTLSRLKPLTCTPKNNLLVGLPE